MSCLFSARYSMKVDVLKPEGAPETTSSGDWEYRQDPDTGSFEKIWVDVVATPDIEAGLVVVPGIARGIMSSGIQGSGTTQKFDDIYENIDWVKFSFSPSYTITNRDRVTNIRDARSGKAIWINEEAPGLPPTTFNVMGVTPIIDPFGREIERIALLKRVST